MIVATELEQARELLGDDGLSWPSGRTVCLDLGLRHRRGDPAVVSDMDEAGWIGRYSTTNPSIAPDGEELIQAQMPIRPGRAPSRPRCAWSGCWTSVSWTGARARPGAGAR